MASICCSPPDRVPATWRRRSLSRGNCSYTRSRLGAMVELGWVKPPISRFSSTVICWNTRRPSGTWARPRPTSLAAGTDWMGCPRNSMEPVREWSRPDTVCRVVVLPAPLAPMRVTISPSSTWKEMSLTAWMAP